MPLWITLIGIAIAALASIAAAISDERKKPYKVALIGCAVLGALAGGYGAWRADRAAQVAESQAGQLRQDVANANAQITAQSLKLAAVQNIVKDLNALDSIAKDRRFYVAIAAGMNEAKAKKVRQDMLDVFPAPSLILCRTYGRGKDYEVTFGVHLSLVAAKAYRELGDTYAAQQKSRIVAERGDGKLITPKACI